MRTSKNLGLFNRFVTLLFHGDWLFLFLFLFLSNAASIASIDESTHWPKKFEERSSYEDENSWLAAKIKTFANEKALCSNFACWETKEKRTFINDTQNYFIHDPRRNVPSKCGKKFFLFHSFFSCFSLISPYTLSLSTSCTRHRV